jgi:hypothetical protein
MLSAQHDGDAAAEMLAGDRRVSAGRRGEQRREVGPSATASVQVWVRWATSGRVVSACSRMAPTISPRVTLGTSIRSSPDRHRARLDVLGLRR